jgi:hypothetical protein
MDFASKRIFIVIFMAQNNCMVHVWQMRSFFDVDDNFWYQLFDKEFLKYKDRLNVIFPSHPPFETNNINIFLTMCFTHQFNQDANLQIIKVKHDHKDINLCIINDNHHR